MSSRDTGEESWRALEEMFQRSTLKNPVLNVLVWQDGICFVTVVRQKGGPFCETVANVPTVWINIPSVGFLKEQFRKSHMELVVFNTNCYGRWRRMTVEDRIQAELEKDEGGNKN